ncbi:MAG: fused MFS/spermidine synthase [Bryobacterales bacterium]|nr:fused MFS/spermidine synthase [Bryobacterales bacterium]MBV9400159.1 fused MFS/spermidine synthase [Bryobacterales bacterium]
MPIYAVTIFLSAFLLFQVQPLIAKFILPWFGGSAAVWSATLLFFQLVLLGGYFYAHLLIRYFSPKRQLQVHGPLLALSLITLPIIPSAYWKPSASGDPTLNILLLLGATVGLPYMLLSSTSPLLQAWYLRAKKGAIPYRLFALSNFGSMLALLSYPLLIEPRLTLGTQARSWSAGYALFALVCAFAGWRSASSISGAEVREPNDTAAGTPPSAASMVFWVALGACASVLLLSTTTLLTQNVAPIPLLWVVPLSIYLLSFIFCFEGHVYQRFIFLPLLIAALALYPYAMYKSENNEDIGKMIAALCAALFVCCMVCHGELALRKPHPRYLTQFYLMVSIGGAAGGFFVAFLAPHVFPTYMELPIAVGGCALLAAFALWNDDAGGPRPIWVRYSMLILVAGFLVYLGRNERADQKYYILNARNFYGVLHVRDDPPTDNTPAVRVLVHGTINHGTQLLVPNGGRIPTSYFGRGTGIARAIAAKGDHGPIRIGILGLGAGVTASLARAGDTLHYYEINPLVPQIDSKMFEFFRACPADKHIFLGDGRLVLERLPSEQLDFLAMDAFTSDSVPIHLLTREAYQIYVRHLKPDGVLAINISNRYMDLEPVVTKGAQDIGWSGVTVYDDASLEPFYTSSTWMVLSPKREFFNHQYFQDPSVEPMKATPGFRAWTDDYSNIVKISISLPPWLKSILP